MAEAQANRTDAPSALDGASAAEMLFASGEMGARVREHDWTQTPLGPIAGWSRALKGNVSTLLSARVQIVLFWGADHIAFYNDAYAPTIGSKHPRALGRPAREGWAELWDDIGPMLDRVRAGESIAAKDRPFRMHRHGYDEEVFFDLSYSPVRDSDGSIQGVLCLVAETTDRVRAQRRAIAERERMKQMFEQAPGFMAILTEPGHVIEFANAAFHQLVGARALVGKTVGEALPETVEQGLLAVLDEVVRSGRPFHGRNLPLELHRTPGEPIERRLLNFVYQPVFDDDANVNGVFVEGTDVTERVRAEERAALSEDALRLAADVAGLGTWDWDIASDTLAWNDATKAMFGIAPDAPCGIADFHAGLHPDDRDATLAAFAAMLDPLQRLPYDVEYGAIGKEDGVLRWIAAKGRAIFDEGDRCVRAVGIAIDVTVRRRAQDALRESEERFRTVADSAPALIWMCDEAGALVFANRWHEDTFGVPVAALLGGGRQTILHPDARDAYRTDFDAARAARLPFDRDVRAIDRNGATRWLHSEARPRTAMGHFAGYVGCDVDITDAHLASAALERRVMERTRELAATNRQLSAQIEERERVEATLRQMQRLEAVGQLTAGVAHDFNNLLTVILGNLDMVMRAAEADPEDRVTRRLATMRSAAERGATLTRQLLAFSRRQRLEARPVDLTETISGMRELLQSSMGGSVQLETRAAPDLWPALVDSTQIELIILNLAINARDAMKVGGTLTVEAANVTLGEPGRPEEPAAGDYVMIAVADSGAGMAPDVLAKAFEPFFTTKEVGEGSGLGLAQVYGFAKQSGGGVGIETALGRGTVVRVYLPRARHGATAAPPRAEAAVPQSQGRRILVVDDDLPVREITASVLTDMGAEVTEAASGAAALAALEAAGGAFDLMVADFAMPGMNGAELAAAAARRWPALPVLFVTGYADITVIADVSQERIVQKPFRPAELQRKVARLLTA